MGLLTLEGLATKIGRALMGDREPLDQALTDAKAKAREQLAEHDRELDQGGADEPPAIVTEGESKG